MVACDRLLAMLTPPAVDLDLFDDALLADPWSSYASIRDTAPVVRISNDLYDVYAISRYDDVKGALKDWQTFSSTGGIGFSGAVVSDPHRVSVLNLDPPEHTGMRGILLKGLGVPSVRRLHDMLAELADEYVAQIADRREVDLVVDLVQPFVTRVIGELVGVPDEVLQRFAADGHHLFNVNGPRNERFRASAPIAQGLVEAMNGITKADLRAGSLGWELYEAAERGEVPSAVNSLIAPYVGPAFDTTISGLGSTLWLLGEYPAQWERLRGDASLALATFNEGVRCEPAIHTWARVCRDGAVVDGYEIPAGARVAVLLGSANRDDRHFSEPDRFDISREQGDSLAFGFGVHHCLGAPLARAEAAALLASLSRVVSAFEIGRPARRLNNTTRGLSHLPATLVTECSRG